MRRKKNIVIFYTDQQRADSLGFMGNPYARTPHLDRLAERGTVYTQHYATHPLCMPSRASFITGCYPQTHRVFDNELFLPETVTTMPEVFLANGWRTAAVGKLHFQGRKPETSLWDKEKCFEDSRRWRAGELDDWTGPYYGFENVRITIGHNIGVQTNAGHYGRWRAREFPDLASGPEHAPQDGCFPECHCWKSGMPLDAHHSTWVADRAVEFLQTAGEEPFYLHISFPDPHRPYSAPAPYHSMFDGTAFPSPHALEGENQRKPGVYQTAMNNKGADRTFPLMHFPHFAGEAYQAVMAQTHAMISLIDDSIGRVLDALEKRGLMHDTILVFTSDHGDFLGDHHFFGKAPVPCRSLLRVPLLICDPGRPAGRCDDVCSNVDVMPTLLQRCGLKVPADVQGVVLPGPGEVARRDVAFECAYSTYSRDFHHFSLYGRRYRVSFFPWLGQGELYDLDRDPFEQDNLFDAPGSRDIRHTWMEKLMRAVGCAEPLKPKSSAWMEK